MDSARLAKFSASVAVLLAVGCGDRPVQGPLAPDFNLEVTPQELVLCEGAVAVVKVQLTVTTEGAVGWFEIRAEDGAAEDLQIEGETNGNNLTRGSVYEFEFHVSKGGATFPAGFNFVAEVSPPEVAGTYPADPITKKAPVTVRASTQCLAEDLIVFSNKPGPGVDTEIWVMDASGAGAAQLTDNTREDWDPAWSPDRSKIAFVSNSQGSGVNLDLMLMDFDGTVAGTPAPLTNFAGSALSARDPAWSPVPGERRVAAAVGANGFFEELWIFDLDQPGSDPVKIDAGTPREIEHLSWSPDGTKIAFCNFGVVYVVPADGSTAPTALPMGPGFPSDWALDWGPMGFVLHRYTFNGQFRLVTAGDDGGNVAMVTTGGTHQSDITPSWSPMSDRIVFVRQENEMSPPRLRIVDPDGSNDVEIPNQPDGSNTEPDWGFGPLP